VDLIDAPSVADLPRLRQDPRVVIASAPGTRMFYLRFDRSRTANVPYVTDLSGNPLATNPFNDLRVRKALSIAINRTALAERVMAGTVTPTGQWLAPGVYSYNPAIPVPAYDPDGARALLAEAGYKDGFKLTMHSATYSEALQAVASMWSRVGVHTSLEMLPGSVFSPRAARQEFAASSGSWGSNSGEAGYFLVNVINSYDPARGLGPLNWTRYSNPALDALTEHAMSTIDDTAREALLRHAEQMAMDDVTVIPLFQLVNFWASRRGIVYAARADERTVAMSAMPAP
jgi:peptide/nickel transport system substrate-binding protein